MTCRSDGEEINSRFNLIHPQEESEVWQRRWVEGNLERADNKQQLMMRKKEGKGLCSDNFNRRDEGIPIGDVVSSILRRKSTFDRVTSFRGGRR